MSRLRRAALAAASVALVGAPLIASALWRDADDVVATPLWVGGVWFAAHASGDERQYASTTASSFLVTGVGGVLAQTQTEQSSTTADPIVLTIPGATIAGVVDERVTWTFTVSGRADGSAGLTYAVEPSAVEDGTLLARTTLRVFPAQVAGPGGDCSAPPAEQPELSAVVLHAPGAAPESGAVERRWCVTATPPGPPGSLDGEHANTARVEARAQDGSTVRARAQWNAAITPDTSSEPALTISVTPRVTSLNDASEPPGP
ncbi:hypothetical protein [Xylanimonas ulmi]|uniref:Ribosomally synthesized peptide with SipW-like signal peptide n=1 Tax=Xylanimonas ulmi TaxID=228973 RepID=A0A4Q7M5V5_9MICO|nr:hypothetical protein [Xylanibacterium ulmi]RZS62032.1 hypothetical protein EV386_2349 [Xylanibacterium ulmi]